MSQLSERNIPPKYILWPINATNLIDLDFDKQPQEPQKAMLSCLTLVSGAVLRSFLLMYSFWVICKHSLADSCKYMSKLPPNVSVEDSYTWIKYRTIAFFNGLPYTGRGYQLNSMPCWTTHLARLILPLDSTFISCDSVIAMNVICPAVFAVRVKVV